MWQTAQFCDSYRPESEDRADIVVLANDRVVFLVADGVGGRENGGPAAARAIALARDAILRASPRQRSDGRFYVKMLSDVDEALCDDPGCGQSTLVVVCLGAKRIVGASVGDSEAWWITVDGRHVPLTSGEGRKPYLGAAMARPAVIAAPTPPMGTLLVATDGLFKYAYPDGIVDVVVHGGGDLTEIGKRLRDVARGSSGTLYDDFAVLLARRSPPS